jgi:putative methyltransferase (TIGR04325 family)
MRRIISTVARHFFPPSDVIEGYEHPELVDLLVRKTSAYRPSAALDIGDARSVLDFGGGCGQHYKEVRSAVVRWAIVETPAMVERAKEFSTHRIRFFTTISDAANWLGQIDLMHSNAALQYTPSPEGTTRKLCELGAKQMIWRRLFLSDEPRREVQSSFLGDNGPGYAPVKEKIVRYERTAIREDDFLTAHADYALVARGQDWFTFSKRE